MRPLTGTSTGTLARAVGGGGAEYLVRIVAGLVLVPVLLARLGAPAYGVWVALAALLALGTLADMGIRTEITRRVASAWASRDTEAVARATREGATILLGIGLLVAVPGFLLAPAIAHLVFTRPVPGIGAGEVTDLVRVTAVLAGASLVGDGFFAALRGVQRSDLESLSRATGEVVGSLIAIGWVLHGGGLWALLVAFAVQTTVDYAGRRLALRHLLPAVRSRPERPRRLRLWLLAGGLLVASQISDVVDTQWDKLVLARYVGTAASAMYTVGTTLAGQAKVLVVVVLAPLVAASAELHAARADDLRTVYRRLGSAGLAVAGAALGAVVVFGPAFARVWLGARYQADAGVAAQLSAVAVWLNVVAAPLSMLLIGKGRAGIPGAGAVANIAVNGVSSVVLTMAIGFDGALYGSIAGNAVGLAVLLVGARRAGVLELPPVRAGVATATGAAVAWAVTSGAVHGWVRLSAGAAVFAVVEAALVLVTARPGDRAEWVRLLGRR